MSFYLPYSLPSDYTLIDIETTGLTANKKITELGAVKVRDNQIVEEFEVLITGWSITDLVLSGSHPHPWAEYGLGYINDLAHEAERSGVVIGDGLIQYREFIGADHIIGHNIKRFDLPTLEGKYAWLGLALELGPFVQNKGGILDTLELSRHRNPNLKSHSVASLLTHFGNTEPEIHRALSDSKQEHFLYQKLKNL